MSCDQYIICNECTQKAWVGGKDCLYDGYEAILWAFLLEHEKHPLMFVNEHWFYDGPEERMDYRTYMMPVG